MPAGGQAASAPPAQPYPQQHPQAAYPYPPPGYPPYPPPGYPPYPQAPGAPAPAAEQPPASAEQPAAPPQPPEPEPEEASDPDPMTALMDDAEETPDDTRDEDPMAVFDTGDDDDEDDALSQDDIEALFNDDDEDNAPIESMIENGEEEDDGTAFDDLEEPDPIPEVFTADETGDDEDTEFDDDDDEDESSGSMLKIIIAVVVLVLLLGSVGAVIFLRDTIIQTFPSAEGLYSMVGLEDDSLGGGLSINDVKSTRESIGGKDVLVVRGDVVNVSERPRPVPMLELRLSDTEGQVVQSAKSAPLKNELIAGDKISFEIQLENPSALARRLEVTFIEREAPGN